MASEIESENGTHAQPNLSIPLELIDHSLDSEVILRHKKGQTGRNKEVKELTQIGRASCRERVS